MLAFWAIGVPYFYFVGFISGFLSLVPYMGVVLAALPPLAAAFGTLGTTKLIEIAVTVVSVHLLALNVLYPKVLGSRLRLNPLIVTISLLFWGFLWGALGLLLAIPVTAALKIILDHVTGLQPLGNLMGEGEEHQA
jgi:predicted PurR-regulated permease PerM